MRLPAELNLRGFSGGWRARQPLNFRPAGPYLAPHFGFVQPSPIMLSDFRFVRALLFFSIGALLLAGPVQAQKQKNKAKTQVSASYPAAEGFDAAGSDAKAVAIADRVMREMGGYENWKNARYFAWSFFGGQYQIWDKQTGDFHWERDTLVANYNLRTQTGQAYSRGKDISATPAGQKLVGRMPAIWNNNSWWLLMPFKLKDSGVTLTYKGPAKTMAGQPADLLQMTFKNVGTTPQNRYEVLVSPTTGLVEEWAYFPNATDAQPAFRRTWSNYIRQGQILLATNRDEATKPARFENIATAQTLPAGVMTSAVPVAKLEASLK